MPRQIARFAALLALAVFYFTATMVCLAGEWKSGIKWPEPEVVTPGESNAAPSDATVLFDGKDLSKWNNGDRWEIADGYAISKGGGIQTTEGFGSCQLHIEWASPPVVKGTGQGRGNSGVYLMGRYEVQILDSFDNKTYFDGQAGAIYKQHPPLVNACRKPGAWQTYDIIFNAPEFDNDGKVTKAGSLTVLHNGVLIQNNFQLLGGTAWHKPPSYDAHPKKAPLSLQFHGNDVRFRNIWIRPINELVVGE